MKPKTLISFILPALLLALAAAARFAALDSRPMHADEAVQTYIFSELLERGDYHYDPSHFHGPLPHFINLPLLRALGIHSLDTLQAWQFRLQPALAGLLLALLAGACAGSASAATRHRAMFLAAVSPTLVYFSRMAIHETLLALCALAVPFAAARWLEHFKHKRACLDACAGSGGLQTAGQGATRLAFEKHLDAQTGERRDCIASGGMETAPPSCRSRSFHGWLLVAAAAFGCMHATKETWSVIAFSWAVAALVLIVLCPRKARDAARAAGPWRIALAATLAVAVAMGISFLLYSDFGRRPAGFSDAWRTLFAYRTGGGHEKPWWYFLADCLGFYRAGNWFAGEGVICLLALAGGVAQAGRLSSLSLRSSLRNRRVRFTTFPAVVEPVASLETQKPSGPPGRGAADIPALPLFLAVSGAAQVVVYSIIKYKTPWLMLVPLASFVPLAAHGWTRLRGGARARARFSWRAAACALAIAAGLLAPMVSSSFIAPAGADFRFVYAPTLPEADAELARIAAALPADARVAVIGDDYWPLPWYFRAMRERAGYFSEAEAPAPAQLREFALVIHAGAQLDPAVTGRGWRVLELRPGYYVSVSR